MNLVAVKGLGAGALKLICSWKCVKLMLSLLMTLSAEKFVASYTFPATLYDPLILRK